MFKLVVLSAFLAVAASSGIAPIAYNHVADFPYAYSYAAAPLIKTVATAPIVHAPVVKTVAAAPIVSTYSAPAVAISHEITKNVHYASQPVVTGYTSEIIKPDLGSIATPLNLVTKEKVLAPARTVATITPQITQVEPELTVRKVPVDVPVAQPFVSEVEVRHAAPVVAAPIVSAPLVKTVAAAPIVSAPLVKTVAAGPAIAYNHYSTPLVAGVAPIAGVRAAYW